MSSTITTYKGLEVLSPTPTAPGSALLDSNTRAIADELDTLTTGKADKVSSATTGHLASLTSDGNPADSGHASTDFALSTDLATHTAATVAHSATSANTASHIVARDASGNFAAGTITATLSGNATSISGSVGHAQVTGLGTAALLTADNSANNLPVLDGSGKLASSVLPSLAIGDTFVVNTQVAMLALAAQTGDVAIRTDQSKTYRLTTTDPTQLANWAELLTAGESPVQTVNTQTGNVVLTTSNISEGTNKYYTDVRAAAAAPVQTVAGRSGTVTLSTSDISGLGTAATHAATDFASAITVLSTYGTNGTSVLPFTNTALSSLGSFTGGQPNLTITAAGIWLLFSRILIRSAGSTTPFTASMQVRRTNNTPALLGNSGTNYTDQIEEGPNDYSALLMPLPFPYPTSNTNDILSIYVLITGGDGVVYCNEASLAAVKIA